MKKTVILIDGLVFADKDVVGINAESVRDFFNLYQSLDRVVKDNLFIVIGLSYGHLDTYYFKALRNAIYREVLNTGFTRLTDLVMVPNPSKTNDDIKSVFLELISNITRYTHHTVLNYYCIGRDGTDYTNIPTDKIFTMDSFTQLLKTASGIFYPVDPS